MNFRNKILSCLIAPFVVAAAASAQPLRSPEPKITSCDWKDGRRLVRLDFPPGQDDMLFLLKKPPPGKMTVTPSTPERPPILMIGGQPAEIEKAVYITGSSLQIDSVALQLKTLGCDKESWPGPSGAH